MVKRAHGHGKGTTMPTGIEGRDIRPNEAGAHGNPPGDVRTDSASGLSADKGVHAVGNPAQPTGSRPAGATRDRSEHTLEGQLRDKHVVGSDAEDDEGDRSVDR